MAIGSQPPIGEAFGRFKITNNLIDREEYDAWAKWFGDMVAEHGLHFGEAKIINSKRNLAKPERIKMREREESGVGEVGHNMHDAITHVVDRIDAAWPKTIDCGPGWTDLVIKCHLELLAVDPEYTVYQVKEKFGSLRFYFGTNKDGDQEMRMWQIAKKFESESLKTCEITGSDGVLMLKDGIYKTLAKTFESQGWVEVISQD